MSQQSVPSFTLSVKEDLFTKVSKELNGTGYTGIDLSNDSAKALVTHATEILAKSLQFVAETILRSWGITDKSITIRYNDKQSAFDSIDYIVECHLDKAHSDKLYKALETYIRIAYNVRNMIKTGLENDAFNLELNYRKGRKENFELNNIHLIFKCYHQEKYSELMRLSLNVLDENKPSEVSSYFKNEYTLPHTNIKIIRYIEYQINHKPIKD